MIFFNDLIILLASGWPEECTTTFCPDPITSLVSFWPRWFTTIFHLDIITLLAVNGPKYCTIITLLLFDWPKWCNTIFCPDLIILPALDWPKYCTITFSLFLIIPSASGWPRQCTTTFCPDLITLLASGRPKMEPWNHDILPWPNHTAGTTLVLWWKKYDDNKPLQLTQYQHKLLLTDILYVMWRIQKLLLKWSGGWSAGTVSWLSASERVSTWKGDPRRKPNAWFHFHSCQTCTLVYWEPYSWLTSVGTTRNTVIRLEWSRIGLAVLILHASGAGLIARSHQWSL